MSRMTEVRAVGIAARQLPGALLRRGCQARVATTALNIRCPVVLVHGYVGSEAVWAPLRSALRDAGFGYLVSLDYNCFDTDAAAVSAELVRQSSLALARTGAPRVHLVGHSMGGLIVRRTVGRAGLGGLTAAAVTIATPHRGAPLGRLAPGRCARIMHRTDLATSPHQPPALGRPQRWLAYYSDRDRLVPAASARLDDAAYGAANLLIPDCGHLTICRDDRLIRSLVSELIRTETDADTAPECALAADPGRVLAAA
jgi:pimeloyl-ACP methyl ester carboxylesterase